MFINENLKQGEMLCSTTVRIEVSNKDGEIFTGTGFFYSVGDSNDDYIPTIITNKHVIEGVDQIRLVFTESDANGNKLIRKFPFEINHFREGVILHPDPETDLCALTLVPVVEELRKDGKEIYCYYINNKIIPTEEALKGLDAIEDILMVGYPDGLWDEVNNLPLVRRGITASHPRVNFNGKTEFVIDAACFAGSSGSPIFYQDKTSKIGLSTGELGFRTYLLGILYGGPITWIEGQLRNNPRLKIEASVMLNLGYAIHAKQLLEIEWEIMKKLRNI